MNRIGGDVIKPGMSKSARRRELLAALRKQGAWIKMEVAENTLRLREADCEAFMRQNGVVMRRKAGATWFQGFGYNNISAVVNEMKCGDV